MLPFRDEFDIEDGKGSPARERSVRSPFCHSRSRRRGLVAATGCIVSPSRGTRTNASSNARVSRNSSRSSANISSLVSVRRRTSSPQRGGVRTGGVAFFRTTWRGRDRKVPPGGLHRTRSSYGVQRGVEREYRVTSASTKEFCSNENNSDVPRSPLPDPGGIAGFGAHHRLESRLAIAGRWAVHFSALPAVFPRACLNHGSRLHSPFRPEPLIGRVVRVECSFAQAKCSASSEPTCESVRSQTGVVFGEGRGR